MPDRRTGPARWAGGLLCWTLAGAMLTAATEAVLQPAAGWWHTMWPLPWFLVPVWALLWAALRAREKYGDEYGDDDGRHTGNDAPTDYDKAA
ncbi:hypothetical protein [Streptomyces sp. NPDC002088]|uniref:hypothetical protein n=1 Tax=Streptomyces sp. NPDC002088 TaxID=3154665 RepID=UPI0033340BDD